MEKSRFQQVLDDASLEEKIRVIKFNYVVADKMRNEISSLKVSSLNTNPLTVLVEPQKVNKGKPMPEDAELSEIFKKIVSLDTMNLTEEEILEELRKIISTSNPRFNFLIERLKILLYRDIVLYSKMYIDAKDEDTKQQMEMEVEALRLKIDLLDEVLETQEINISGDSNYEFFFMENDGKVIFEESIKNLPIDCYYRFALLLSNLKKGRFKKLKRLSVRSCLEVQFQDARILFVRLSHDTFLIMDGFIKKTTKNSAYLKMLDYRIFQCENSKPYYLSNLNNPEFRKMHAEYFEDILKLLNNRGESMGGRS